MNEKFYRWLILIALISAVGGAYALAWRGKPPISRQSGAWTVSLVSGLGAVVATTYVIGGLDDFKNPNVSFGAALIGNLIVLAICVGAWVTAIRFAILALRKGPSS